MRFGAPGFLPLLALPAGLLLLWFWQLWRRRVDARAFLQRRHVPVEEHIPCHLSLTLLPRQVFNSLHKTWLPRPDLMASGQTVLHPKQF